MIVELRFRQQHLSSCVLTLVSCNLVFLDNLSQK